MKKTLLLLALFIGYLSSQAQTVLTIENQNIVNTDPNWQGYNVPHDVKTTLTFRNNAITSVNTSMYLLQAGDDYPATTINNLDGAVITGNKLTWNGVQTGSIITHGLFVGYNINQTVKWNSLTNVPYNIIFKSGASAAPNMNITAGAASYNIVKGGRFSGRCKGINGARFYNNTFYGDAGSWYLLLINANSDGAPTYPGNPSINTKVKNNIFYTTTKTPAISIDAGSRTGFECDYNVYWCEAGDNTPVFLVGGTSYTWAQWKALGYDAHSVVVNPNFNNTTAFVPAARLNYGTDLGTEFNTGLSTSATWVVGSTPATQVQNGTWQVGARIYAPTTYTGPIWYVSPTGSDVSGNGSPTSPWASLSYSTTKVTSSGHKIHMNAGTYYESNQCHISVDVSLEGDGKDNTTVYLQYQNTDIDGGYCLRMANGTNSLGQSISNIKLSGNNLTGYLGILIYARNKVSIHDCIIENFRQIGVKFDGGGTYRTENSFYNNTITNCGGGNVSPFSDEGSNLRIGYQTGFLCYGNTITQPTRTGTYVGNGYDNLDPTKGCKIYNNSIIVPPQPNDGTHWIFALEIYGQSIGLEIYGNTVQGEFDCGSFYAQTEYPYNLYVHDNTFGWNAPISTSSAGIQIEGSIKDVYIARNTIKNVDVGIYFCQFCDFWQPPSDLVENIYVYCNVMYNIGRSTSFSSGWGIRFECGADGTFDRGDQIIECDPPIYYNNVNIWNNTIVAHTTYPSQYGIELPAHARNTNTMNIEIRNNIIVGFSLAPIIAKQQDNDYSTAIDDLTILKNVAYNNGNSNNSQFSTVTLTNYVSDTHIKSNPLFVNASSYDYHLSSSTSPAYHTGNAVTLPFGTGDKDGSTWNNPPSIGAYEFTGAVVIVIPTVTTTSISNIATTTATGGGNITSDGGASITARGVCWSTSPNPTITSSKTSDGTGTGSFTSNISGLTSGTTYHVRAYSTNSAGTAYGSDVSFTTTSQIYNGPVWYVSTTGSDATGNGSPTNPWKSLYYATTHVATSGNIIHVNAGTHTENNQCPLSPNISIEGDGSTVSIVKLGYANSGYFEGGILLSGGSNTSQHISNITFDGNNLVGYQGIAVYMRSNVSIYNCIIKDFNLYGVRFGGTGSTNNSFHDNIVTNSGGQPNHTANLYIGSQTTFLCYNNTITQTSRAASLNGNCVSGYEASYGMKFYNNTITATPYLMDNVWKFAIEIWLQQGLEMYGNTIKGEIDFGKDVTYGTYSYGVYFHHNIVGWDAVQSVSTNGIQFEQTGQGIIVTHNTFKNLDVPIYFCQYNYADDYLEDIWIYTNLLYNVGRSNASSGWGIRFESGTNILPRYNKNIYIWNNTIVAYSNFPAQYGIELPTHASEATTTNIDVRNNIIVGFGTAGIIGRKQNSSSTPAIDHLNIQDNVIYGNGNNNNAQFLGVTLTNYTNDGGIKNDPLFVSSPSNLHLSSSASPAYHTGTSVIFPYNNTDYDELIWNNPPSIGAYEFSGTAIIVPTVTTTSITNITTTTATGGGNVTSDGGGTVTAKGVCWSISTNPTISNGKTSDGTGIGIFTSNITTLTAGTIYHVRAYATNSAGTAYGADLMFTTNEIIIIVPTVTTTSITNITTTTATGGGNVTSDGGGSVTAKGVCWNTSTNPTISNSKTIDGTGTGSFTSNITSLTPNTLYYVRAYATNSAGTAYGNQASFTTSQVITTPTLGTLSITNITTTTATGNSSVSSDGNASVTDRGVCWSTTTNPTIANSHTSDGTGTGNFTSSLTSLTPNTLYYARAYATNSAGTGYSNQVTFTTNQVIIIVVPTVTTTSITNITTTTATGGGNVTSDGGATVTARGICWSTSANPTITSNKTSDGTGTGIFTSNMSSLTSATTYHVRAYATNSAGTAYGTDITFITISQVYVGPYYVAPTGNDATGNGSITNPWYNLTKAWEVVQPGDIIYMRGGSYSYTTTQYLLNKNGTAANPIKIWAYQNEKPIINASSTFAYNEGINIEDCSYIHFKGLEITGYVQKDGTQWYNGIIAYDVQNCTFENLNVHHNCFGMSMGNDNGITTGNLIYNCDFHHNEDPITAMPGYPDLVPYSNADGLTIRIDGTSGVGTTNSVIGCRMWYNSDDGFDLWGNEGMIIIKNSWSFLNGYNFNTGLKGPGDGNGFKLGRTYVEAPTQILRKIYNCVAYMNSGWGFLRNGALCNMEVYNNTAYKNGTASIDWSGGFFFGEDGGYTVPLPFYVKNNVSYQNVINATVTLTTNANHNSWDSPVTVTDADFVNLISSELSGPRQSDGSLPNIGFLNLATGSDLINAGVDVGIPYKGLNPDMGAFEYNETLPQVTKVLKNGSYTIMNQGKSITNNK
jgi:hypothetical protein